MTKVPLTPMTPAETMVATAKDRYDLTLRN